MLFDKKLLYDDCIVMFDVICGIVVMGIFLVNVVVFVMLVGVYFNLVGYGGWYGYDYVLWFVNFILIDGKMCGLFLMLFGVLVMLVIDCVEVVG